MHMRHMHMYIIIMLLLSFFMDAFCLSFKIRLCFDGGILAPSAGFVKRFFAVFTIITNFFDRKRSILCFFGVFSAPL